MQFIPKHLYSGHFWVQLYVSNSIKAISALTLKNNDCENELHAAIIISWKQAAMVKNVGDKVFTGCN